MNQRFKKDQEVWVDLTAKGGRQMIGVVIKPIINNSKIYRVKCNDGIERRILEECLRAKESQ
jgi:hypothetical protein